MLFPREWYYEFSMTRSFYVTKPTLTASSRSDITPVREYLSPSKAPRLFKQWGRREKSGNVASIAYRAKLGAPSLGILVVSEIKLKETVFVSRELASRPRHWPFLCCLICQKRINTGRYSSPCSSSIVPNLSVISLARKGLKRRGVSKSY